jgi:hypothetical protein
MVKFKIDNMKADLIRGAASGWTVPSPVFASDWEIKILKPNISNN